MTKQEKDNLIAKNHFTLGCVLSPIDERDWFIKNVAKLSIPLSKDQIPTIYELPTRMKVLNQGNVGSCVAHAISTAISYGESKLKNTWHNFSRGMIYANRREDDYQGEGMYVRQALKQLNHDGDCLNTDFDYNMPYDKLKPIFDSCKENLLEKAAPYIIENYFRLTTEEEIKQALLQTGSVVAAIPIYSKFSAQTPMPDENEKSEGLHAVCLVGWDKTGWIFQNSWSVAWGKQGFFHIPYEYPVSEWWGFTVNTSKNKKKSWFDIIIKIVQKIIDFVLKFKNK